jgi:hypothetical protein
MRLKLEAVANTAVIVTCLVVTYAVAERFMFPRLFPPPPDPRYRVGDSLEGTLRTLPFRSSQLTTVLVVSKHCHFCTESVEFYSRLFGIGAHVRRSAFQTIVLGATGAEDGEAFVREHQLHANHVLALPSDSSPKISSTPTILLVDASGHVRGTWTGKLSSAKEREVLNAVTLAVQQHGSTTPQGGV